ncbi:MAG TPA: HD domain-containing phosphohydrolase [Spirochaetia bacterium]|nr:HD domain-containing phosphohydrolase [Spirochaetia bacterium]
MPRLVLKVSEGVPELPAAVQKEKGLSIKRVKKVAAASPDSDDIVAWLVDRAFVEENGKALCNHGLPAGSVLLWNPKGAALRLHEILPDSLLYDEVISLSRPELLQRTLRNLFRQLHLEKELARQDELLRAKEAENTELLNVGIALSAERDNDKLLADILLQLRKIAQADAGTLYLLEKDEKTGEQRLRFKIAQNDSNPQDYKQFVMPLSKKTISGYVASTGSILNIPDAYKIPPAEEYGFNVSYDTSTGYRSRSMLTVPMQDHKGEILGVIQLINRKPDFGQKIATPEEADKIVTPFPGDIVPVVKSLASQAAVSLENNKLYEEIETLFEGFVRASVKAIESRDPTTSGHSNRVAVYTVSLADAVARAGTGAYRGITFTAEQRKEIRYASLLHDFGKVGVREHVLVKAERLYPDQLKLVRMRFDYIRKAMMYSLLKERFNALSGGNDQYLGAKEEIDRREAEYLAELDRYVDTIETANIPTVLAAEPSRVLDEIRGKTFQEEGREIRFLEDDEYIKLKILKGSLDEGERREIESHVTHTWKFLSTIPWTTEMKNIPTIAYGHHEKLTGQGYPRGINGEQIPIQTRMMTVSDIYDALTASDRPYKKAVPPDKALDILNAEVREKELDAELVKIFIEAKIWQRKDVLLEGSKE